MIELTQGEIADKISILELKEANGLESPELVELWKHWKGKEEHLNQLRDINSRAWHVVEKLNTFLYDMEGYLTYHKDEVLADFKRCHFYNRMRVEVKNRINEDFNQPVEKKTWKSFTN